jgi:enoyl-CoA hydratase/carnithine racemase
VNFDSILYERRGAAAVVTFNRPEVHNAFDNAQRTETIEALRHASSPDSGVRCVVLKGAGTRAFSSGQDVREATSVATEDVPRWIRSSWIPLYEAVRTCNVPVLAVLRGYTLGAGLQVAMSADIRIAGDSTVFGLSEIVLGLPAITGAGILRNHVSMSVVQDMILTGERLDAATAQRVGLVTRIVPDPELEDASWRLVERLCAADPLAVRLNKRWWDQMTGDTIRPSEVFAETAHALAYTAGGAHAAIAAFLDKRRDDVAEKTTLAED